MKATYHVTYRIKDWDNAPFGWLWAKRIVEFKTLDKADKFYRNMKKENKAKVLMVLTGVVFE